MKPIPFFTVLMLLQALSFMGKACIHTREPLPGVTPQTGLFTHQMPLVDLDLLDRFVGSQLKTPPCQTHSPDLACADHVAAYLYLGRYKEAYELSSALLKTHSDDYGVLINHALVLELRGQYKEALKYLKKAIALAPGEHGGCEWIHQRLLEKRIAGKTKPKGSVLGLDFGNGLNPVLPDSLMGNTTLQDQLAHYIDANLYFAEKPDPLFASLLFDYANLVSAYNMGTHENYIQADEYGCTDTTLPVRLEHALQSQEQMEAFSRQMETMSSIQVRKKPTAFLFLKIACIAISLIGLLLKFLRKRGES